MAAYVSNPENGLTRKQVADNNEIVCQLVPQEEGGTDSNDGTYKFTVYINTVKEKVSDSLFYLFSYHSTQLFALVAGADTLKPVLSERIANGRRDVNQFTVVFALQKKKEEEQSDLFFMVRSNALFPKEIIMKYESKDIKKAFK